MSENPLQALFRGFEKVSISLRQQLSNFIGHLGSPQSIPSSGCPPLTASFSSKAQPAKTASFVQPEHILLKGRRSNAVGRVIRDFVPRKGGVYLPGKSAGPVTKEELGRATWTFLHTLAAQYPDNPTRQQKKDVKELFEILSRMYPCKECADHFKEILRSNPVQVGSQVEFSQWLCHVHNVVNRSLAKPVFPCERVDARWGKLECEQKGCEVLGRTENFGEDIH